MTEPASASEPPNPPADPGTGAGQPEAPGAGQPEAGTPAASGALPPPAGPAVAGGPVRPPGLVRRIARRLRSSLSDPGNLLALVLIGSLALRVAWLDTPRGSQIFDEAYYVNAARVILGWPVAAGDHYAGSPAGLDPNTEHPPLGKLLIAGSMAVFGDNGIGWRAPSVVAAMVALIALYLIVRAAGETAQLGVLAVAFFSLDNLAFVHGRIATLDILVLAPMLVGAWLGLRRRWLLAGAVTGLALLMKLTALYGLFALLLLLAMEMLRRWLAVRRIAVRDFVPALGLVGAFLVVGVGGLAILDSRYSSYKSPIDHLSHMVDYGAALTKNPGAPTSAGSAIDSAPWQWLANDGQISYFRTVVNVTSGDTDVSSRATIDFRGALNPAFAGGVIVVAFAAAWWLARRRKSRLAAWALAWAAANYLPYIALAIVSRRIMYFYYFLPVVPAITIAVALLLARTRLPRIATWAYLAATVAGFIAYFPFRQIP